MIRLAIKITLYNAFLVLVGLWGFSHYGERYWIADLLSNFMFQFMVISAILTVLLLLTKSRIGWVLSGTFACYVAVSSFGDLYTEPDVALCSKGAGLCKTEAIRIVQYNMLYDNDRVNHAISWMLEESEADIIVLQEVSDKWKQQMRMLELGFPYTLGAIEDFPEGLAIYSKIPLSSAGFRTSSLRKGSYGRVEFQTPHLQVPLILYNVHAVSPMDTSRWYMRNFNLLNVAHEVGKEASNNRIIIGDFNTTRWSAWFKKMRDVAGLRDAQKGRGYAISWSPFAPKPMLAGLHIDHMLVSENIAVTRRVFGPDLGSDHLPVVTTIHVKKNMLDGYGQ